MNDRELTHWAHVGGSLADWASFKSHLANLPPETAFVQLRVLGESLPLNGLAEGAFTDDSDVLGLTATGAACLVRATRIRGMDVASRVKESIWPEYFAGREQAERILRHAVNVAPTNGLALAWLAASAVDGDDDLKGLVAGLLSQGREVPLSGYSKLLSARTEKWGGSHAAMWQVARAYSGVSLPWSLALVAKAHYENWLYLALMDERPVAEWEAATYFTKPEIRDELLAISEAVNGSHSDDPYEKVYAHDVLAAVMAEAGFKREAGRHLRNVGRFGDPALLTGGPWWRRALIRGMKGLPPF